MRDASRDVVVRLNKQVMLSPEFLELWSKIKQKTAYRVSIDTEQLVENCVKAFREMPHIPKTRLVSQNADIHHALAIDGIRYVKLDGQESYVQEIFDTTELLANLDRNAVKVEHNVYDHVVTTAPRWRSRWRWLWTTTRM